MKARLIAAVALLSLALAACGGTAATAHSSPPSSPSSPPVVISYADEGRVCAALNALGQGGEATVAQAYRLTFAQVAKAVHDRCPKL